MVYVIAGVVVAIGLYGLLIVRAGARPTPTQPRDRNAGPVGLGDREDESMAERGADSKADVDLTNYTTFI